MSDEVPFIPMWTATPDPATLPGCLHCGEPIVLLSGFSAGLSYWVHYRTNSVTCEKL